MDFSSAISAYNSAANISSATGGGLSKSGDSEAFSNLITDPVNKVVSQLKEAESVASTALVNKADVTDIVTAINSADLLLKSLMAVRDRLVAAHQEIFRMQI